MDARRGLVLAVLAAMPVARAAGQANAGIELGAYGAWFVPDGDVASSSGAGAGARGTMPFGSRFAVDLDLGWHGAGGGELSAFVPAVAVLYGTRSGASGPFLGAGVGRPSFSAAGADAVADAALYGSSHLVLPKPLQWITANIGIHHVHHMSSRIPNYRLQECLDANPDLQVARQVRMRDTWNLMRLTLWDEQSERLVGFRELRRPRRAA